jgi:hypothetical protein
MWKQVRVEFLDRTLRVPSKFLSEGGETMKRKLLTKVGMERCVTLVVVELQTRGDKT